MKQESDQDKIPEWDDVLDAHDRIRLKIHRTPVFTCAAINSITGSNIFFKCENFQKTGAFKYRGASNAVISLAGCDAEKGVATHSSGNHAAALALAARERGIPAYIVMPESSPSVKKMAVASYGAQITYCEPTLQARESALVKVVEESGATFIHPYNNFDVICGQATAAREFLEQSDGLDIVMVPVGGGGLLSGTAISVKNISNSIKVIAAEPENANDAYRSFMTGVLQPPLKPNTVADGLLTALSPLTFRIVKKFVDNILCAREETIIKAMQIIWERMKVVIEPSSAVPLASILENPDQFYGRRTGIILTGGNVDLAKLPFL